MTRIETILKKARMVIADKEAERWTDEDLLSILDEGHKDLCQHSGILKAKGLAYLNVGSPDFALPSDCWQLTRVAYENTVLPFVTHTQLDSTSSFHDWQADEGKPEAIIYDRRNMTTGKVYPIPTADEIKQATLSSLFGVITSIGSGSVRPAFGVSDIGDAFGIVTTSPIEPPVVIYYTQIPSDIEDTAAELVTPIMFDTALKYYVAGNAFLLDIAEEYQAKGLQQLGFYNRELELAAKTSATSHQMAAAAHTSYRTGF